MMRIGSILASAGAQADQAPHTYGVWWSTEWIVGALVVVVLAATLIALGVRALERRSRERPDEASATDRPPRRGRRSA